MRRGRRPIMVGGLQIGPVQFSLAVATALSITGAVFGIPIADYGLEFAPIMYFSLIVGLPLADGLDGRGFVAIGLAFVGGGLAFATYFSVFIYGAFRNPASDELTTMMSWMFLPFALLTISLVALTIVAAGKRARGNGRHRYGWWYVTLAGASLGLVQAVWALRLYYRSG